MIRRGAFRPALWDVLEGRIALSNAAVAAGHASAVDAGEFRAADVPSATSAPTSPSYEELTTTYANGDAGNIVGVGKISGTTQTEYRLTVPTGTDTTTTTESITLPGDAGLEKVVDVSTRQGNATTEDITTTLPDGTIATKTQTRVIHGDKTVLNATLHTPGVGVQTTKGTILKIGGKTITNEVITTAGGKVYHFHRVVTQVSPLESSATSTTTGPDGAITGHVVSTTVITPLTVPAT
jgi:hypothetical protein